MISMFYMEHYNSVASLNAYGKVCILSNENMNMHPISENDTMLVGYVYWRCISFIYYK